MNKNVNYMELLKESVGDRGHDTTKSVDMKGPFLDPILGYDGGGELPTYKDASSILERYYFNQDADKGVNVIEPVEEDAAIPQVGDDKGALKDVPEDVDKSKADAKKATELKEDVLEEEIEDDVENAVIERLIAEMEEDEDLLEEDGTPQDPAAKFHEPSGDPDDDNEEIIDGDDHKGGEDVVKSATFPAGSDGVGKGIKAAMKEDYDTDIDILFDDLLEMDEADKEITAGDKETPDEETDDEETPKDLDVDKETNIKSESGSPIGNPSTADEDEPYENLDEQFEIFKEEMEEVEEDSIDLDDNDIIV